MAGEESVRVVQITVWLGASQKVRVHANSTLRGNPDSAPDFFRSGSPSTVSGADLVDLVDEILTKLKLAYPEKRPIDICVDGKSIIACSSDED